MYQEGMQACKSLLSGEVGTSFIVTSLSNKPSGNPILISLNNDSLIHVGVFNSSKRRNRHLAKMSARDYGPLRFYHILRRDLNRTPEFDEDGRWESTREDW